MTAIFSRAAN